MTLHWITFQQTPYNDALFCALNADSSYELMVHFLYPSLSTHPWITKTTEGYRRICYHGSGINRQLIKTSIHSEQNVFVIAGWHNPTMWAVLNILIQRRQPFFIWTDTPNVPLRRRHVLKKLLRSAFLVRIFKYARYVMGTGQPALDELQKMGCPSEKLINFPYWIDLDMFCPGSISPDVIRDKKNIVYLSSGRLLNSMKGHDLAIRALGLVKQRTEQIDFRYRIAGVGPDHDALITLSKQIGLENNVEFLGWLEGDELPSFYHSGHILLHPSQYEPYGVAVLEAMASGLLVIGSDMTMAVRDRISHMENGLKSRDQTLGQLYQLNFKKN